MTSTGDGTPVAPSIGSCTDGLVGLRACRPDDRQTLIAGRDATFHRFLGDGSPEPRPTACTIIDGAVAGWVDFDAEREWLRPGEVNVGYALAPEHRGGGVATRAVKLLLHRLALDTEVRVATLLIHPDNAPSQAVARRSGFVRVADVDGQTHWRRTVPPLTWTDGVVTLRRPEVRDLERDLGAKDREQIRWMWLPGQREAWEAMDPDQQREHARRGLAERIASFGAGPRWTFSLDAPDRPYVAYLDCDLANPNVPAGEANISFSSHPDSRGEGFVSRGVLLVHEFLRAHTGATQAHLVIDADNAPSLRVARSVGADPTESWLDRAGRTWIRHTTDLT